MKSENLWMQPTYPCFLFLSFWLHWVFVSAGRLSLVVWNEDYSFCSVGASHDCGFSYFGAQVLGTPASVVVAHGPWNVGLAVVAHGPGCSAACEISQDQGSNACPQHWQADSYPLYHQGCPTHNF